MSSPRASRQTRPRWLDPKLFLGILLVLGSMAAGARIIANADQTAEIWVAKEDIPENSIVTSEMLGVTRVRFTETADSEKYLSPQSKLTPETRAVRTIAKGEFVPAKALTDKPDPRLTDIAIPVEGNALTTGLGRGDKVDVWVVPEDIEDQTESSGTDTGEDEGGEPVSQNPAAELVLSEVTVIGLPEGGGLGGSRSSAVTVRFPADDSVDVGRVTYLVSTGQVSIAKHVAPGE